MPGVAAPRSATTPRLSAPAPAPPPVGPVVVGIDVRQGWLDVAVRPASPAVPARVANTADGSAQLVTALAPLTVRQVVLEATGRLELPAVVALRGAGHVVAVVNPRQARAFARGTGHLAKTDARDAAVLAHRGAVFDLPVRPLPSAHQHDLAAWVGRRQERVAMQVAERNRRRLAPAPLHQPLDDHLDWLRKQIVAVDAELDTLLAQDPAWTQTRARLQRVPGVGPVVSATVQALLPELGSLTPKQIAALAGLAPLNRDSGKLRGTRRVWGGRAARLLHGGPRRHPLQPPHRRLRPAPGRCRQTGQGGDRRLYAQAAHHPQCHRP